MTIPFPTPRLRVRYAANQADLTACQRLRHLCFFGSEGLDQEPRDADCEHLMVLDEAGALLATARLLYMATGAEVSRSFAAEIYDMAGFSELSVPMVEVGRFCVSPDAVLDADVLRAAWGAITGLVDARGVRMLFGSTSFAGTDPDRYGRCLTQLAARHLGPAHLRPRPRTGVAAIPLGPILPAGGDPLPAMMRSYLAMGGWVGDHAIIDRQMQTLHVFTCVDVANVPPSRARALRALAHAPITA